MLIGQVARATGLSTETIRFYEKYGLIGPPRRRANNYKEFPEDTIKRLQAVMRLKRHGFTLQEIKTWLELFTNETYSCRTTAPLLEGKLAEIEARIADLGKIRKRLIKARAACEDHPHGRACRVLEEFFDFS